METRLVFGDRDFLAWHQVHNPQPNGMTRETCCQLPSNPSCWRSAGALFVPGFSEVRAPEGRLRCLAATSTEGPTGVETVLASLPRIGLRTGRRPARCRHARSSGTFCQRRVGKVSVRLQACRSVTWRSSSRSSKTSRFALEDVHGLQEQLGQTSALGLLQVPAEYPVSHAPLPPQAAAARPKRIVILRYAKPLFTKCPA
jgi:hypothetical protein